MYRELKNRNGESKQVEGLYSRENVPSIGQEERERKKRRKFATDFDLINKTTPDNDDDPNFLPNKSPWLFLIALEAMLRTFTKAGTYSVKDHISGEIVPNVASRIFAIDVNKKKFDIARKLGATDVLCPTDYPDEPVQKVKHKLTGQRKVKRFMPFVVKVLSFNPQILVHRTRTP